MLKGIYVKNEKKLDLQIRHRFILLINYFFKKLLLRHPVKSATHALWRGQLQLGRSGDSLGIKEWLIATQRKRMVLVLYESSSRTVILIYAWMSTFPSLRIATGSVGLRGPCRINPTFTQYQNCIVSYATWLLCQLRKRIRV